MLLPRWTGFCKFNRNETELPTNQLVEAGKLAGWQGRSVGRAWAGFRSIAVRSGRVCVSCKPWQKEIPYISCSPPSIAFIRCVPFPPISSASLHISAMYLSFVKRLSSVNLHNYLARSSFIEGKCANWSNWGHVINRALARSGLSQLNKVGLDLQLTLIWSQFVAYIIYCNNIKIILLSVDALTISIK